MASQRRATAFMALIISVLLLVVMPGTTGGAVVAAAADSTETSYVDYFLGDLFENPSSMNRNMEPKAPPRFRPWRIIDVPDDGVLAFDCTGDVPTLRVVPRSESNDHTVVNNDGTPPPPTNNTCGGGAQAGMAPTQYKFSRQGGGNGKSGFSALFWQQPSAGEEEEEGAPPPPRLMPVPKFQLKAILKAVAAIMESLWRKERGDEAPPESDSVVFSADMVVFYSKYNGGRWLLAMGREDVEFGQPWEKLHCNIKALNLGIVDSQ